MTRTEYLEAMARAFPESIEQDRVCRRIDQRNSDKSVYDLLVNGREPAQVWYGEIRVRPEWDAVIGDPI